MVKSKDETTLRKNAPFQQFWDDFYVINPILGSGEANMTSKTLNNQNFELFSAKLNWRINLFLKMHEDYILLKIRND